MKRYILLIMALTLPFMLSAQTEDDDMYFVPSKKSAQKSAAKDRQMSEGEVQRIPHAQVVDYGSSRRSDDEYNRRYKSGGYAGRYNESGNAQSDSLQGTVERVTDSDADRYRDEAEDYAYSRRILRFHSPRLGIAISSPWYWDMVYDYGVYDYLYDSYYYYDPYLYSFGWGYGWSWGPWASWYGPIWGWHTPYAWTYWGWGPGWYGPGWHGHGPGVNRGQYAYRGTVSNRFGQGERIRTSALAGGANAATGRGTFGTRTSALGRNGYDTRTSTFNRGTYGTVNANDNRYNSGVIRGLGRSDGNRTSVYNNQRSQNRVTVNNTDRNTNTDRTSVNRNTYTPSRSSGSTFGGGNTGGSRGSFGGGGGSRGGGFGGGGGVSRGGGRR